MWTCICLLAHKADFSVGWMFNVNHFQVLGTNIFYKILDLFLKNILFNNLSTVTARVFIFHLSNTCDKTFLLFINLLTLIFHWFLKKNKFDYKSKNDRYIKRSYVAHELFSCPCDLAIFAIDHYRGIWVSLTHFVLHDWYTEINLFSQLRTKLFAQDERLTRIFIPR